MAFSYMYELAEKHPEYFTPQQAKKLVDFKQWADRITSQAQEAQERVNANEVLDGRHKRKLLGPGPV